MLLDKIESKPSFIAFLSIIRDFIRPIVTVASEAIALAMSVPNTRTSPPPRPLYMYRKFTLRHYIDVRRNELEKCINNACGHVFHQIEDLV
jgi:hypothetical protein